MGSGGVNGRPPYDMVRSSGTLVRAEELGIVIVVLLLWVAAIALFINRWGKIRLMEPYQPYFEPEVVVPPGTRLYKE